MTPEEYIEQLKRFAKKGEVDQLLAFAVEHGPGLQESMTCEQRQQESDLGHYAIKVVDLQEAARQNV